MEAQLLTILEAVVTGKIELNIAMLSVIIILLWGLYKFVLVKMKNRLESVPTEESLNSIITKQDEVRFNNITELNDKLEILLKRLDVIENTNQSDSKQTEELKRDLEHIKQILNQFQGHLLYSRKGDDFGNKELK